MVHGLVTAGVDFTSEVLIALGSSKLEEEDEEDGWDENDGDEEERGVNS